MKHGADKPYAPEARRHIAEAESILAFVRERLGSTFLINQLDRAALELQSARRGLRARRPSRAAAGDDGKSQP